MSATVRRIGVIADTHVGEYLDAIPAEVFRVLDECELIIHAGDICRPWVLDELARIAPVMAVSGDHDRLGALPIPRSRIVTIGDVRIGVIHGRRWYLLDIAVVIAHVVARRRIAWRAGLHRWLMRQFPGVDCIVYGHWHQPDITQAGSTLIFSPGAVCPWGSLQDGRPVRSGARGIADRWVRRYRVQLGPEALRPSVGVIDVSEEGVVAHVIPLGN